MPDPTENQITQERSDLEFRQIRPGESDQEWDARMAQGNPLINVPVATNQGVSSSDAPVGGSVIPPVNTVGENIDQTVNPGGVSAQDLATIQQAKSLYTPAQQIPVTPTPSNAALMPTLNQPINVGTSSGQITGSHGVYVDPGFVAPWGALMQKQAAQDEQTNLALKNQQLAKQARDKAFKFERPATPLVDDPHFQKSLNESGRSLMNKKIDEAKDLYGPDWQVALKSDTRVGREFKAEMDGLNIIARNANLMTEKFAEIKEGIEDGSTYYSPGVLKSFREYEQAMGRFEKGDVTALGGMRQILERIDGEMELNNFLKDSGILTKVVAEETGRTGISGMQDFMKLRTTDRKSYDKNINAMVENVRKAKGLDSSYTEADIRTALEGHFQNKSKSKTTLKSKKGGAGGLIIDPKDISFEEADKKVLLTVNDGKGEPVRTREYNSVSTMALPQGKKNVKFEGVQTVSQNGEITPLSDIQELNPVSFQVISYDDPDDNSKLAYKKVVTAEVKRKVPEMKDNGRSGKNQKMVPTGKFKEITETIEMDADASRDQLVQNYGKEAWDAFENNFNKMSSSSKTSEADELGI
jgi:hypothetical protein